MKVKEKVKDFISRIKIAFWIVMNGRYIEEYNRNLELLTHAEKTLFEACKEFESIRWRFSNDETNIYLTDANSITCNRIVLPVAPVLSDIEKKPNPCSSINNIDIPCNERFAGIGNRCVLALQKDIKPEDITPDLIQKISEEQNIPVEKIYIFKNGTIGKYMKLEKSKYKSRDIFFLIGHFGKDHSIYFTIKPNDQP